MSFLVRVVANALALAAAAWLLPGIAVAGPGAQSGGERAVTLLVVAVIFGVVNALVRPVVKFVSFPLIVLTLGLLIFVINALMLLLTHWLTDQLGLPFRVEGFWTALVGALVISVVTWVVELVLPSDR